MEKENFAKVFGLGEINNDSIIKLLAAGTLMGKARERIRLAKIKNPRQINDICRDIIMQSVGEQFPGLEEKLTTEQVKVLINLFDKAGTSFSRWI